MPAHCAVVNCSDKYVHSGTISFHRFPFKRKDLLQKWKDFTQRSGQWMPSKWSAVCSRHFVDADFSCSNNRKTLKKDAVPTLRVPIESLNIFVARAASSNNNKSNSNQSSNNNISTEQQPASSCSISGSSGIKSTCRFCGLAALNCVSFEKSFELFGMIQKCFPTLQILQDDTLPLPKDICAICCKQLEQFSQFSDVVTVAQSELQRKYKRQLKIKQEPVVRVKQEACDSLDNLFPDEMDMGLDEGCCEHDPGNNDETEQKFQFCDFPMLNAQDIINNCDIMEIINLDDPFINIADDADVTQSQPVNTRLPASLPSANEMLQAEMLTEEHNYAKEDWQLPVLQQYKTEKVENVETSPHEQPPHDQPPPPTPPEARSSKPIVTNVSQIPNPMIRELLPQKNTSKPNIVVLNDSVVQSSAFRLHNCSLCTTQCFTADSLNQHYAQAHATSHGVTGTPMVSVPPLNILDISCALKLEGNALPQLPQSLPSGAYWQPDWLPAQLPAKRKIDILDMQRSFLHHNDLLAAALPQPLKTPPLKTALLKTPPLKTALPKTPPHKMALLKTPPHKTTLLKTPQHKMTLKTPPLKTALKTALLKTALFKTAALKTALRKTPANANNAYAKLAARYRRLQHKCRQLRHVAQPSVKPAKRRHRCRHCRRCFSSMQRLQCHRRRTLHFVLPPHRFAVKCFGCMRLFRSRLGLRQHMRYICQLLPLRNARLQSYKCRHCKSISFTHWRVYRWHELKCRLRKPRPSKRRSRTAAQSQHRAQKSCHICSMCQKSFSSLTGLKQHRITHSSERRYKCNICERVFKRRNGLSQHVKGYHLQLKPHQCPVCQHRYALKCDMLRCRHSQRRGTHSIEVDTAKT